jgi:hypothetical protein
MYRAVTLGVILAAIACSDSSAPGGGGGAPLSALIDGAAWSAPALYTTGTSGINGTFGIGGSTGVQGAPVMALALSNISGPGTYPLGVGGTVFGGSATISNGASIWTTPLSGEAGTVTVSSVSPTRIAGTFSFTATPALGTSATGSRVVTQGTFDMPLTNTGSITVPAHAGNRFGGTLGGSSWNAAHVVMVEHPNSGVLTIGASNDVYNINIIISGFTGPAVYTMNTGVARHAGVMRLGTIQSWGGTGPLTGGTLTVSSLSAARVVGSYNITVNPNAGASGTLVLTGTFDVGIPQ